jgi:hypothetical protein
MRINLITDPLGVSSGAKEPIPVSLTISPSYPSFGGDYRLQIDGTTLMQLLRDETNLPAGALNRFEGKLGKLIGAQLLGVELSDGVLTDIGYFVD